MSSKSKAEGTNAKAKGCRLIEVFSQMRDDGCEFFVNSQLHPTVEIPDDGFQRDWAADSQRIQDLVISLYYEMTGERITSSEREFLMALLREECRKGGRRHSENEAEETDSDVIVQAVLFHMNTNESFTGRTADLAKVFRDAQKSERISQEEPIPVFTNIFSRRLRRLVPVLRGYGIAVTLDHKEEGSHCTLQRLDSFQQEPAADDVQAKASGASSAGNARKGKDLPPTDDSDGENRVDPPTSNRKAMASEKAAVTDSAQRTEADSDQKGGAK